MVRVSFPDTCISAWFYFCFKMTHSTMHMCFLPLLFWCVVQWPAFLSQNRLFSSWLPPWPQLKPSLFFHFDSPRSLPCLPPSQDPLPWSGHLLLFSDHTELRGESHSPLSHCPERVARGKHACRWVVACLLYETACHPGEHTTDSPVPCTNASTV